MNYDNYSHRRIQQDLSEEFLIPVSTSHVDASRKQGYVSSVRVNQILPSNQVSPGASSSLFKFLRQ